MITDESIFEQFERSVLAAGLPEPLRSRLALLAQPHSLPRDISIDLATAEDALVFVGGGAIKLVAHASQDREQVVAFYFAGDLLTVPVNGAHSYSLHSLCGADLLVFPYSRFLEQTHDEPDILECLLNRHALSLQRSREKTIALGRKSASERLASFLMAMGERIGRPSDPGIFIDLPMSRRDIADSLGLTIETVSRQFSLMRECGLVETRGRSNVILTSLEALEQRSGSIRSAA